VLKEELATFVDRTGSVDDVADGNYAVQFVHGIENCQGAP
jgi:hypothetical protein